MIAVDEAMIAMQYFGNYELCLMHWRVCRSLWMIAVDEAVIAMQYSGNCELHLMQR